MLFPNNKVSGPPTMSTIAYINRIVIPSALAMLPDKMNAPEGIAMMLTTGLQESNFKYRHQLAGGPAGGFWGFEEIGVQGVMEHRTTKDIIAPILQSMGYPLTVPAVQDALDHNDILAAIFARLLLWRHPNPLPLEDQSNKGWMYYVNLWRPGKPRQAPWDGYFQQAWTIVKGT